MILLFIALNLISFTIGFFIGRVIGAIKVYFMTKAEARKFIWGRTPASNKGCDMDGYAE